MQINIIKEDIVEEGKVIGERIIVSAYTFLGLRKHTKMKVYLKPQPEIEKTKNMFVMICCGCGKDISGKEVRGSMKHPFCIKCYYTKFLSDDEYFNFLRATHG